MNQLHRSKPCGYAPDRSLIKKMMQCVRGFMSYRRTVDAYDYHLEHVNLLDHFVQLRREGKRRALTVPIHRVVNDASMTRRLKPVDAARIGYHYGKLSNFSDPHVNKRGKRLLLIKGGFNIISIARNGMLNIEDSRSNRVFSISLWSYLIINPCSIISPLHKRYI